MLVVGAGPGDSSAAYHLARLGHEVKIYEAGPMAGGMMHFGIPSYRLPRDVLDAGIKRIEAWASKIVLNHRVDDLLAEKRQGDFDAIFVAVGAHISKRTDIPSRDAGKMFDAVSFLKDVESGNARNWDGASPFTAAATPTRWTLPGSPSAWAMNR